MSSSRRGLFRLAAKNVANVIPDVLPEEPPKPVVEGTLSPEEQERYSRQLLYEGWGKKEQIALRDASVLIVGAGALGSPVASYLAGAGVGRIGIADDDIVELSNLPRQHLHQTSDLDEPKAHSAVTTLQLLNPEVMVEPYQVALNDDNADGLILGHDLVVDCTDSFESRYAINAACCRTGVQLIEGGVVGMTGMVMAIRPGVTPCYGCAFPTPPPGSQTCAEAGIMGPAAGVVGSLMAMEAIKLLADMRGALLNAFLHVDITNNTFARVGVQRDPECPDCGVPS